MKAIGSNGAQRRRKHEFTVNRFVLWSPFFRESTTTDLLLERIDHDDVNVAISDVDAAKEIGQQDRKLGLGLMFLANVDGENHTHVVAIDCHHTQKQYDFL